MTGREKTIWAGGSAAVLIAALTGVWMWGRSGDGDAGVLPFRDKAAIAEGQPDWPQRDRDGYLPAPPHDAAGHNWHHPDGQLIAITMYGSEVIAGGGCKSRMDGYDQILSDQEIVNVLAYIKSTWPDAVIRRHNEINAQAGG